MYGIYGASVSVKGHLIPVEDIIEYYLMWKLLILYINIINYKGNKRNFKIKNGFTFIFFNH